MNTYETIPARIVLLGVVLSLLIVMFNLRAEALGSTFAMGGLDLRIDSHALYNGEPVPASSWALKNLVPHADKFFNLGDVKPGDSGEATISFHVSKDAWLCLNFRDLTDAENGENEPEGLVDVSGAADDGELAEGLEFFAWHDDGDNLFEVGEAPLFGTSTQSAALVLDQSTYALADSKHGAPITASSTRYIGISWCAGDLIVDVSTASVSCDGAALGNVAQTDSFSVDVSFEAVLAKDHQKFTCKKKEIGACEFPVDVRISVSNEAQVYTSITTSSDTGGNSASGGGATSRLRGINLRGR